MNRSLRIIGILLGIGVAALLLNGRSRATIPAGPHMHPECGGALRELVIHYVAGDAVALPVYRSFLPQLPADVVVYVVCPDQRSFDELAADRAGAAACRLKPIVTGHPITVWSRDRWVALDEPTRAPRATLLAPRAEDGAALWPARAGDAQIAFDIASALPDRAGARRLGIFFDGGDLLADESIVFVTPAVLGKNLGRTVGSRDELEQVLTGALGRKIVFLTDAPDHHAGMFTMAAGDRTMLVGDPSLGRRYVTGSIPDLPDGPDFSAETQRRFDAVAAQVASLGYRVVRIPTILSPDGKTYLTYVNVITDRRASGRIVYVPTYQGAAALNDAAAQVWRDLGYEVRPVDCTSCYRNFGTLHCLVNVLRSDSR